MQATAEYGTDLRGDRVREHTAPIVNRRIDRSTQASIHRAIDDGRDAVVRRLAELDREWDVDRALTEIERERLALLRHLEGEPGTPRPGV